MKSLRDLAVITLIIVLLASIAVWCLSTEAQGLVIDPYWTCVFEFKQQIDNPQPLTRIYIHVNGKTEGQAAISAHKSITDRLTTHAQEQLVFVEAQLKK